MARVALDPARNAWTSGSRIVRARRGRVQNARRELGCRDHADERSWRHLDTCQFHTILHARIPRIDCPTHSVRQVRVPWAEARGRFTLLLERLIIDVIQQCSTLTGACRLLRISWDEA